MFDPNQKDMYGILWRGMDAFSIYLHVPFCRHRCSYCDFNTFAGQERNIPAYVDALCREIAVVAAGARVGIMAGPGIEPARIPVHTVFFGGGTPSLLNAEQVTQILDTLREQFDLAPDTEITLEANPGTVTPAWLGAVRRAGANRLSFGMQSAHPDDLRLLERQHDFFDVAQAVRWSREAGFDNLSVDLIFGLPQQSLERWKETVERAIGLEPDHLSLYALTIEPGTPLQKRWSHGMIPTVDDDLAADMYEHTMRRLPEAGFEMYEISNFARRVNGELRSARHNLQYWRNLPYLGFGAGAHGYVPGYAIGRETGFRTMNAGGIRPFIERSRADFEGEFPRGPATRRMVPVDRKTDMQETMMVGLRLVQEGVSAGQFERRFEVALVDVFGKEIDRLTKLDLLEWVEGDRLRLTPRGVMVGNQVFINFVGG